jgi:hypothetical protein
MVTVDNMAQSASREGNSAIHKIEPVPGNRLYGKSKTSLFQKKSIELDIDDKKQHPHHCGPD